VIDFDLVLACDDEGYGGLGRVDAFFGLDGDCAEVCCFAGLDGVEFVSGEGVLEFFGGGDVGDYGAVGGFLGLRD
jgi:hypothetical protein